jgi:thioesterase domain-containing protein
LAKTCHLRSSTDSQTSSSLVPIQAIGKQPPFFCIHPVGGNVLCYRDLARYLGIEQPFYALQALGLSGEQKPLTRIEDMAAHYIEALQTIQPQGPYYLGGWSLGGIIAFEMAQQLHQQGYEVALLALIDSYMPTVVNKSEAIDDAMLVASIAQDLGGIFGQNLSVSVDQLRQLNPDEQLNYVLEKAKRLNILPPEIGQQQMHQMLAVFKANHQAMYSYIPQIYPGKVTLLCASEQLVESNQSSSWGKLAAGGIEVHQIQGNHYTIVQEPQVQVLAKRLGVCMSHAGKIALIAS